MVAPIVTSLFADWLFRAVTAKLDISLPSPNNLPNEPVEVPEPLTLPLSITTSPAVSILPNEAVENAEPLITCAFTPLSNVILEFLSICNASKPIRFGTLNNPMFLSSIASIKLPWLPLTLNKLEPLLAESVSITILP